MKYTCSIEINRPVQKVIDLFTSKDNLKNWQEGFESYENLSDNLLTSGSKTKLVYKTKNHVIELTETIIENNLPQDITALYEHAQMSNTMNNCFSSLADNGTRIVCRINYIRLKGFMPKFMAFLMPGFFKKQTDGWLRSFKKHAESLDSGF